MPCDKKQVINPDTYEVVVLDGKAHAIAKTFSDGLVGYYIDNAGNLRATHSNGASYEYSSWLAFRLWARKHLYNPVLESGSQHVVKVVNHQAEKMAVPGAENTYQPAWLKRRSDAAGHDRRLSTHVDD